MTISRDNDLHVPMPPGTDPKLHSRESLKISRCPHCGVDSPNINRAGKSISTNRFDGVNRRWSVYSCGRCGGLVVGEFKELGPGGPDLFVDYFPRYESRADSRIPVKPRGFLQQAIDSAEIAPAGSIMLSASAVDAMLKEKNLTQGSLFERIVTATEKHIITESMKDWAHRVRLDANDQRHADEKAQLPSSEDARQTVEFASALAEYLFVLPSKVADGLRKSG